MPKKLVRRGRVCGYRPTREQLEEVLELAQKGIEDHPVALLRYSQGDEEIYSHGDSDSGKISRVNLQEIIEDAGDPGELHNLHFSVSQEVPVRRVEIQVGSGDWTTYLVESDDPTWAYGRYHELTDKLLISRSLYAKGHSPSPQILKEGTDNKWRPAAWELVSNWKTSAGDDLIKALWTVLIFELVLIAYAIGTYYDPGGSSQVAKNDQHNAAAALGWIDKNSFIIFLVNVTYIAMILALKRWMRYFLRSVVLLQNDSFLLQLSPSKNRNDPIRLITLYITFGALMVSIVALMTR